VTVFNNRDGTAAPSAQWRQKPYRPVERHSLAISQSSNGKVRARRESWAVENPLYITGCRIIREIKDSSLGGRFALGDSYDSTPWGCPTRFQKAKVASWGTNSWPAGAITMEGYAQMLRDKSAWDRVGR